MPEKQNKKWWQTRNKKWWQTVYYADIFVCEDKNHELFNSSSSIEEAEKYLKMAEAGKNRYVVVTGAKGHEICK